MDCLAMDLLSASLTFTRAAITLQRGGYAWSSQPRRSLCHSLIEGESIMKSLHLRRLTALIGVALAGGEAHAATTWTVTSTGEPASITSASCASDCTLRDAINAAANGDTIQFAPALDGATIALSMYSNPAAGAQFGA